MSAFSVPASTDSFIVGPHCLFTYDDQITLNDRTQIECYWVDDMQGFESPDVSATSQASPGEDKEVPDPGSLGGRTMTLTGYLQAGSYAALMEMSRTFLDIFSGIKDERMLIISTHDSIVFGQPDMGITCRPSDKPSLARQIQQTDVSGLLKRNFSISLRASINPLFMGLELQYASLIPNVINTLGRTYDRSYDLAYTTTIGVGGAPAGAGNTFNAVHAGAYFAQPLIKFHGQMSNAVLTNNTTGQKILLTSSIVPGGSLSIDIATGEIYDGAGRPAASMFDSRSDWMTLAGYRFADSGINELDLSVSAFDNSALVEVWWRTTHVSG